MPESNVLIRSMVHQLGTPERPHLDLDGVQLEIMDPDRLREVLLSYKDGAWVWTLVKPITKTRSGKQNRYYRGVLIKRIAEHVCGYPASNEDCEAVHKELAKKFLGYTVVEKGGFEFEVIRSTTTLNTKEMEEYHEHIRRWASDFLSIYLPLPNEVEEGVQ